MCTQNAFESERSISPYKTFIEQFILVKTYYYSLSIKSDDDFQIPMYQRSPAHDSLVMPARIFKDMLNFAS